VAAEMKPGGFIAGASLIACLAASPAAGWDGRGAAARDSSGLGLVRGGAADSAGALPWEAAVPDSLHAPAETAAVSRDVVPMPDSAVAARSVTAKARGNSLAEYEGVFGPDFETAGREPILEFVSADPCEALVTNAGVRYMLRGFYGGPESISIRGRAPWNTGFLMDGVPVTDAQIETFDPHWLPLSGVDRVEVLKGPSSALYGGGASAGLINTVSQDVLLPVPVTRVNVWFGSFDARFVGASFTRSIGGNLGFMAAYDYLKTAGFVEGADYKGEKLYGKVSARFPSTLKLDIIAYRHVGDAGLVASGGGRRLDSRSFINLSAELGSDAVVDFDAYYSDFDETMKGGAVGSYSGTLTGVRLAWINADSPHPVRRLGVDFKSKSRTQAADEVQISTYGEFAYRRGELAGEGLLRLEKNSGHDFEYGFSLPLNYAMPRGFTLYTRVDRAYRYPLQEVSVELPSWDLDSAGSGDLLSASDTCGPGVERTLGVSGGISWNSNVLSLSLNVFYYDVEGATVYRTDDTCEHETIHNASFGMPGGELQVYLAPVWGFEGVISYSLLSPPGDYDENVDAERRSALAWGIRYSKQFTTHIGAGVTFAGRRLSSISLGHSSRCVDETCDVRECVGDAGLPPARPSLLYAYLSIDQARAFVRIRNLLNENIPIAWDEPSLPMRSYEFGLAWDLYN
jgi:hypothetical protein